MVDKSATPSYTVPYRGNLFMKKISKINPIAKELPKFGKRIVPDKRRDKSEREQERDTRCQDHTRFLKRQKPIIFLMTAGQYDKLAKHAHELQKTNREQVAVADLIRDAMTIFTSVY